MYNHGATGCTKLEMYKIGDVQAENIQNWKCTTTLLSDVQNVHNRMYNFFLSKPINMGSSFEDLDARSSKVKTVYNLD